jgi:hypothetical protein
MRQSTSFSSQVSLSDMNKPRQKCIFCDNHADSKEHLWPEWMHPHIGTAITDRHNRHTITRWPDGREQTDGPTDRMGGVVTVKIRAVCATCNNGWMNRIEGSVRPFLDQMVLGEPVVLNAAQIEALVRWCALKLITMEHAGTDVAVTPKSDRIAFKDAGVIPPYFNIYVGNHASANRSGLRRSSRCMALSPEGPKPPLNGTTKNIQTTTIILGRIFVHLNAARVDGFKIEDAYFVSRVWDECRIWPNSPKARRWPHRPLLDDDGLSMIARSLDTIFSRDNTTWLDDLPGG